MNKLLLWWRMPFRTEITPEDIALFLEAIEPTLEVDKDSDGRVEYISVDEAKAKFRPRCIKGKWYCERIISYEYEDCGDLDVSLSKEDIGKYVDELESVGGVEQGSEWEARIHVWYNGCEEPY